LIYGVLDVLSTVENVREASMEKKKAYK